MTVKDRHCAKLGCTDPAFAVVNRNGKERTVCEDHQRGFEVVEYVE